MGGAFADGTTFQNKSLVGIDGTQNRKFPIFAHLLMQILVDGIVSLKLCPVFR
jgi:hypothetical protein